MTALQTILYGQFTPPQLYTTRRHFVMCHNGREPKPYTAPPAKPNQQLEYADKMYEYLKLNPGASCRDVAVGLGKDVSYAYTLRDILLDQGRIDTVRGKPIKRGGAKTTLMYAKECNAG